jgi:hypothetical protein
MPTNYSYSNSLLLVDLSDYLIKEKRNIQDLIDDLGMVKTVLDDLLYLLNIREIFTGNSKISIHSNEPVKDYVLDIMKKYAEILGDDKVDIKSQMNGFQRNGRAYKTFLDNYVDLFKFDIKELASTAVQDDQKDYYFNWFDNFLDKVDAVIINVISLFSMVNKKVTDPNTNPIYPEISIPSNIDANIVYYELDRYTLDGHSIVWTLFTNLTGIEVKIVQPTSTSPYGQGHGGNKTRKKRKNKKQGGTKRVRR